MPCTEASGVADAMIETLCRVFSSEIHPRLAHLLQHDGPMPRLNIVGCGFFVFEKIVCGFDGIRAAT